MGERKWLGHIYSVKFGFGGYDNAMFGLSVSLRTSASTGVENFVGGWADAPDNARWTRDDQIKFFGEMVLEIAKKMKEAKVECVQDLKGVPVEIVFEDQKLKSWRILTEVIR